MDSEIRIVCIQVAPAESGGSISVASSGQRGEVRAVLERAMDAVGRSDNPNQAHLAELERRAVAHGGFVKLLPAPADVSSSVQWLLGEAENSGQGAIVKTVA